MLYRTTMGRGPDHACRGEREPFGDIAQLEPESWPLTRIHRPYILVGMKAPSHQVS